MSRMSDEGYIQHSLFPLDQNANDIVFTPDDLARDIVNYFQPSGMCLDPCMGDGAFFQYLPVGSDWCEIEKGRDFFAYHKPVDWVIGNPPYSIFQDWLRHSFTIAKNIVYLLPISKVFTSYGLMVDINNWGGYKCIYVLGSGRHIGFDFGFAVGAVHFEYGYTGCTKFEYRG